MRTATLRRPTGLGPLALRAGRPDDLEAIIALNVEHNGAECDPMIRALFDDPRVGPGRFAVVVDDQRVVSTLCLMSDELRFRDLRDPPRYEVRVALGRPEFVVTDPTWRGRGLVRRLMELVHAWSASRGDLGQLITGIPYFYRQFGYEYATAPRSDLHFDAPVAAPAGWTVRRMEHGDVDTVVALHETVQARAGLVVPRSAPAWHAYMDVTNTAAINLVAVDPDGGVGGCAVRLPGPRGPDAPRPWLTRLAATAPEAALALAAHAAVEGRLAVGGRVGSLAHRTLEPLGRTVDSRWEPYFRIPDPVRFLHAVRPVLEARLADSPFAGASGELFISFYRSSMTIDYMRGRVVCIERERPEQNPLAKGGVGIPPDLVATLLLGGIGPRTMAEHFRDVELGAQENLMETLFPRVDIDYLLLG